ncbi:MAG: aspartate aminotransferase family protein, partial [Parvibaculum sp.]|nr:aspartate aminotransferase family protein [Parvibaculum sp.]
LNLYRDEGLFERARALEPKFAEAAMALKDHPLVLDIRTIGLAVGFDLAPVDGLPGKRGFDVMRDAFHNENIMLRVSADTLAMSPPLIAEESHVAEIFEKFRNVLDRAG